MGPDNPSIVLIGEAPGRNEIKLGRPFVGVSGKELTKMIELSGLGRDDVYITSVVRVRPYSIKNTIDSQGKQIIKHPNWTPSKKEVKIFAPLFDWEIQTLAPKLLVPLGNTSIQRLLVPQANVGNLHGQIFQDHIMQISGTGQYHPGKQQYWIAPMYHPAAYLYARRLEQTVREDWEHLGEWLGQHPNILTKSL
ncbi:uracil-DNA glycosylase [Limosilactobacillus mucosae]|uniref:uracil-DNA glycosylase n=1 Tax=Limosilactobacillus mucosae TaxID=97478 RepID=UPI002FD9D08C